MEGNLDFWLKYVLLCYAVDSKCKKNLIGIVIKNQNLPSAVPWTRRYCTAWKFFALAVTVVFCTQSHWCLLVSTGNNRDTYNHHRQEISLVWAWVCMCETYSIEFRIFFRLSHVALCIDGIWKKQIIADSACHYSDCANSGKCYEFKKYKKNTIIVPLGDRSNCHSTFKNSTARSQDHRCHISTIRLKYRPLIIADFVFLSYFDKCVLIKCLDYLPNPK